ncbi:hypothetical protein BJV78DRAFT_1227413 [Lactifluus subvellereus]|nr:hypothetical protein BJV78DRAFT_1227413 [Lactifluus subvellereus]
MEQSCMHSQQPTHQAAQAPDAASFDILQSPLYPSFPECLGENPKAAQPPLPSPPYVPQHYPPDRDPPLEAQRSPPPPYRSPGRPQQQGYSHLRNTAPLPALQQPQPRQAAACPLFPQAHDVYNSTTQGFSPQVSQAPLQPPHVPLHQWLIDPSTGNPSAQFTAVQGGPPRIYGLMYPSHPQLRHSLPTTHPSVPTHIPPEQSPATTQKTAPSQPMFHERNEDSTIAEHSQQLRSWGGAGSLDPATGVFSRAADHPRIRTAQACEKCRARKAKCSGEHPTCQRCLARGLDCVYASERRMRGPNKPKPLPPPLAGRLQPSAAGGQKTRKRASTIPTATHSAPQIWAHHQNQQQRQQQQQKQPTSHQEQGIAAASSPASSAGSGSLGYPPLSESDASPMTPHSSLDSRHPSGVLPPSPRIFIHDFSAATRTDVGHLREGNNYDDGAATTGGVLTGAYGQDIFRDVTMSLDNTKTLF